MAVEGVRGSGPTDRPQNGGKGITPQELKGKTDDQLLNMLKDRNLSDDDKRLVLAELVSRQQKAAETAAPHDTQAADDSDLLKKIYEKLIKGEALTAEEKQLLQRLGIDVSDLKLGTNGNDTKKENVNEI